VKNVFILDSPNLVIPTIIVAVDGTDVTQMDVREITSMMADCADKERRLTIISTRVLGKHNRREETKETYSP
jgi:hypothetical protein